ncbi:hypothetical protein BDC45DRAFT_609498 [Circinella umbellata]|nr:hypothetical protein BDC45DRAFT_609498 [Circinella umbellata]
MDNNDITMLTSLNFDVPEGDHSAEFKIPDSSTQTSAPSKDQLYENSTELPTLFSTTGTNDDNSERGWNSKKKRTPLTSIQSSQTYVNSSTSPGSTYRVPVALRECLFTAIAPISASFVSTPSQEHHATMNNHNGNRDTNVPSSSSAPQDQDNNEYHNIPHTIPILSSSSPVLQDSTVDYKPVLRTESVGSSDTQSTSAAFSISKSESHGKIIAGLEEQKSDKIRTLNEQCKNCCRCRKPFQLQQTKHNCYICGQIFCEECASYTIFDEIDNRRGDERLCNICYDKHNLGNSNNRPLLEKEEKVSVVDYGEYDGINESPIQHPHQKQEQYNRSHQQQDGPIIPYQLQPTGATEMLIPPTTVEHTQKNGQLSYDDLDTTIAQLEIQAGAPSSDSTTVGDSEKISFSESTSAVKTDKEDNVLRRFLDSDTPLLSRISSNYSTPLPMNHIINSNNKNGTSSLPFLHNNNLYDYGTIYGGSDRVVAERESIQLVDNHSSDKEDKENGNLEYQYNDSLSRPQSIPTSETQKPFSEVDQFQSLEPSDITVLCRSFNSHGEAHNNELRACAKEIRGHINPIKRSLSLPQHSISGIHHTPTRTSSYSLNRQQQGRESNVVNDNANSPKSDHTLLQNAGESLAPTFDTVDEDNSRTKARLLKPCNKSVSESLPNIALTTCAITHARRIIKQLMANASFDKFTQQAKNEWEEIIIKLLLKVADNVRPDVRSGDYMDIRTYVKIKKMRGGVPSDSFYIKGFMCSQDTANMKMVRNITHPRILILLFSLDYGSVETENEPIATTPVTSQEWESFCKLVAQIVALKPTLLLLKSNISQLALGYLLEANIPIIYNVKDSVIEAVARCTRATIVPSVDKLQAGSISFGHCGMFEIKTLMDEYIPNQRKTYLIFNDCKPDLGGTIVLCGARNETLGLIKSLIDFMVFIVHSLRLETSLLHDSFADNSSLDRQQVENDYFQQQDGTSSPSSFIATVTSEYKGDKKEAISLPAPPTSSVFQETNSTFISSSVDFNIKQYQDTVISASQFVVFPQPYIFISLKETMDKLAAITSEKKMSTISSPTITTSAQQEVTNASGIINGSSVTATSDTKTSIEGASVGCEHESSFNAVYEELVAKRDYLLLHWEAFIQDDLNQFNILYHQNIIILYSNVCTATAIPCGGPEIRLFEYYSDPSDITLGNYIYDLCHDATQPCVSNICEYRGMDHYQSYVHHNARINVVIESFPCPQAGVSESILMWSYCRKCKKSTPIIPMSEDTWNYSFGKFLEGCLYQKGVHCRSDICPHDIGLDHVRYFSYRDLAVQFQYEQINLFEVSVSPIKLPPLSKFHIKMKKEGHKSLRIKINKFYQSITERNKTFPFGFVNPRKLKACKAGLQEFSQQSDNEMKEVLRILQTVYETSAPNDTLTINWVRRILNVKITDWDLKYADFVKNYLRPERELRKMLADKVSSLPLFDFLSDIQDREEQVNKEYEGSKDVFKTQPEKCSTMKDTINSLIDNTLDNLLPLEYPQLPTEHMFPDSFVVVNEDKASTIIAYTLSCEDYLEHLKSLGNGVISNTEDGSSTLNSTTYSSDNSLKLSTDSGSEPITDDIQEILLRNEGSHLVHKYRSEPTEFFCKVFFVEQFDALRRNCGIENSYIASLASCVEWGSSADKSESAFLKTSDDRFLMKLVSRNELNAFLVFAPVYFHYMHEAFFRDLPTILTKIFGFYTIGYINSSNGKSMRMDVVVMENLFYHRNVKKIFNLKGTLRNRHIHATGNEDVVLLDENLVELIYQSPLFIREYSKKKLRSSLHNDTLFLSMRNIMDYSLLVGVDEDRQELVAGIVNYFHAYTWDRKLESWVRGSGILGAGEKEATMVSPRQYRRRFTGAMERYFVMVPDKWSLTSEIRTLVNT